MHCAIACLINIHECDMLYKASLIISHYIVWSPLIEYNKSIKFSSKTIHYYNLLHM